MIHVQICHGPPPRKPCHAGSWFFWHAWPSTASANSFPSIFMLSRVSRLALPVIYVHRQYFYFFPWHRANILFLHATPFWVASNLGPVQTDAHLILLSSNSCSVASHITASLVQIKLTCDVYFLNVSLPPFIVCKIANIASNRFELQISIVIICVRAVLQVKVTSLNTPLCQEVEYYIHYSHSASWGSWMFNSSWASMLAVND